jgi:hypothetical protein
MMKTLPSLKSVGRYLVPEEFDAFAITRDPKNNQRVLSLTDGATVIAGEELDAMLLKEFARKEDLKVLYKVPNPIGTQAYAFPRVVAEEKEIEIAKKKDEKVKLTMWSIFSKDFNINSYVPIETLRETIKLPFLHVEDYKLVYDALNKIYKTGETVDISTFGTPDQLLTLIGEKERTDAIGALTTTLYGSHLKTAKWEDRLKAFETYPSVRMAQVLQLKAPMTMPLKFISNRAAYDKVDLEKLEPDDDVIMSNHLVSQEFYQSITIAKASKVYKLVNNVGVPSKQKKVQPLKVQDCYKAKDVLRILSAIERSNTEKGAPKPAEHADTSLKSSENLDVQLYS